MSLFPPLDNSKLLSLMPTYKCTASCDNCGTQSSPNEKTWLSLDKMMSAIDEAFKLQYKAIVFTGGEATLAGPNLLKGIARASSYGLAVRLVTNAHWAVNQRVSDKRLSEFASAGLTEINFSTGDQHSRFVPISNIIHATKSSVKYGIPVSIMVETIKGSSVTKDFIESFPDFIELRLMYPNSFVKIFESPWMPLSPEERNEYPDGMAINQLNLPRVRGCDSILKTTTIQADGRIGACCGLGMRQIPELQLGHIDDISIAEAERISSRDFLKRWIKIEGPERILAWTSKHNSNIKWENMYAHRCQACVRIYTDPDCRKVIEEHHQEKMLDVLTNEWLLYHYED
ncbi:MULTISPECIES: radical SAM protein [Bacillus cereus group]|uniref:radical SAM protein n=1 Tax=Bacillus anthracis TaxID=1392 RepID=UPI0008FE9FF6|nr:radical SAM protein [Bacillus anthracis]OJD87735.1 radical SAM protein [Bacillus anthracis]